MFDVVMWENRKWSMAEAAGFLGSVTVLLNAGVNDSNTHDEFKDLHVVST